MSNSEIRKLHREAEWCCTGRKPVEDLPPIVAKLKRLGESVTLYTSVESSATARRRGLVNGKLPRRFARVDFSNFQPRKSQLKAVEVIEEYLDNIEDNVKDGVNLAMVGNCGTGKSHLACWLFYQLAHQALDSEPKVFPKFGLSHGGNPELRALYPTMTSLDAMTQRLGDARFGNSDEKYTPVLNEYTSAGILIIDEFGAVSDDKAVGKYVQDVITKRYDACLITIIISNQDAKGLRQFMGERAGSRFFGACDLLTLTGDDLREQGF